MIDIIKQTPAEYSAQSRDYQVIARLYTALFNISKMYIDDLQIWNSNIDNQLTSLRATTLNFEPEHSWDEEDLEAVTSCFKYLMRHKGATKALEYCINILMKIENLSGEEIDEPIVISNNNVTITVPENLLTMGIIEDLVKYLLPAGLTYDIIKYKSSSYDGLLTNLYYKDTHIAVYKVFYNSSMTIGPNGDIRRGTVELPLEDSSRIWFKLINFETGKEEYIPESAAGFTDETIILTLKDGTEVTVPNIKSSIKFEISDFEKAHYITDTFIYAGNPWKPSYISNSEGKYEYWSDSEGEIVLINRWLDSEGQSMDSEGRLILLNNGVFEG